MKKSVLGLLGLLAMSVFTSCNFDAPENKTYVVEIGRAPDSLNTLPPTNSTDKPLYPETDMMLDFSEEPPTFSDFCVMRDYLYNKTPRRDYKITGDVTFEQLKIMLTNISYTEGSAAVNFIVSHGYHLDIYSQQDSSDSYCRNVWISVTETGLLY